MSLFSDSWQFVVFGSIYLVAILYWVPLGIIYNFENPLYAVGDQTGIPDNAMIIWFCFLALLTLTIVAKAIKNWIQNKRISGHILLHLVLFIVGVLALGFTGSIYHPFRL